MSPRAAVSLYQQRLLAGSVRPQHLPAGSAGVVNHPAVCPLHPAPADDRPATVAAVARELGLSWDTVNTIAMDATQMIVAADTGSPRRGAGHRGR